ncbi:MAG: hypothetical protein KUG56_06040, partial [Kordiimonadaceae bacterium]|nr:hypothetical protein [Kordiimonadaceae bacterium]
VRWSIVLSLVKLYFCDLSPSQILKVVRNIATQFVVTLIFVACSASEKSDSGTEEPVSDREQIVNLANGTTDPGDTSVDPEEDPGDTSVDPEEDPGDDSSVDFLRPAGIFVLSEVNSLSEIRDYPFVDGYVLRESWTKIEVSEGNYDFSQIDSFVTALDAIDQKLTLAIFAQRVPDYIVNDPEVELYNTFNNNSGALIVTAVPWDAIALDRYELFFQALGDHKVMDLTSGVEVELRNHPVLHVLGLQIMGLGGVRDPNDAVSAAQSYDRETFTQATLASLNASILQFPDKFAYLAFFGISDDNNSPELGGYLMDNINSAFNSDQQPQVGIFAENLACDTPAPGPSNVVDLQQDNTYIMFQMLQPWQDPFANPGRTDICSGPAVGIEYGFYNFNARYFEVYYDDLNFVGYEDALQEWHDILEEETL